MLFLTRLLDVRLFRLAGSHGFPFASSSVLGEAPENISTTTEEQQRDQLDGNLPRKTPTAADELTSKASNLRLEPVSSESVDPVQTLNHNRVDSGKIKNIHELKERLKTMHIPIVEALGWQSNLAAYKKAIRIELCASSIVVSAKKKTIKYKGTPVTTTTVESLLTLCDGSMAIMEVKANKSLKGYNNQSVSQMKHLMSACGVDHGFILNFPKAPPEECREIIQEKIWGLKEDLVDTPPPSLGDDDRPEIAYFHRLPRGDASALTDVFDRERLH